jgi:kynurenine formamidase
MGTSNTRIRRPIALLAGIALFASGALAASLLPSADAGTGGSTLPGFSRVVSLSHVNDPRSTPLFPGDPRFTIHTVFTVPEDGYYLEVVHEGAHTGTHYSAPCHFHPSAICMDELRPSDLVLPAVVVDVRAQVQADPDYLVRIADLQAWEGANGPMPSGAAVLLYTGCSRFWADGDVRGEPNYYNCGSGLPGDHQPGFTRNAVKWLIGQGVLGQTGALGTDTFGPDPSSDGMYRETWLTLRKHRMTIENMTHLGALPATGAWIVLGSPRNRNGSGAPGTVFGLIP